MIRNFNLAVTYFLAGFLVTMGALTAVYTFVQVVS